MPVPVPRVLPTRGRDRPLPPSSCQNDEQIDTTGRALMSNEAAFAEFPELRRLADLGDAGWIFTSTVRDGRVRMVKGARGGPEGPADAIVVEGAGRCPGSLARPGADAVVGAQRCSRRGGRSASGSPGASGSARSALGPRACSESAVAARVVTARSPHAVRNLQFE
jgi:hypothetical protein